MSGTSMPVTRRTLVHGTAWTVPVVTLAAHAPALAASPVPVAGTVCRITRAPDPSHVNTIEQNVYFGWSGTPNGTVKSGTATTFTIRIEQTQSSSANPGAPNITWGSYFTGSLSAAVAVTPSAGFVTAYEYTYTITSTQQLTLDASGRVCGPFLVWDSDNAVRPTTFTNGSATTESNNTVFTVTGAGSTPSVPTTSLKWNVGGTNGGINDNWWRPLAFVSSTGYPALPGVGFSSGVNSAAANYCLNNDKTTWATSCYRCVQNSFTDLCGGTCDNFADCTTQNCTGYNCR